jgi:hypothetical protein
MVYKVTGMGVSPSTSVFRVSIVLFLVMEHWWDEIDRGKPKYSEKNLSQCHFVRHKSHTDGPGIEPGPPWWDAGG